MKNLFFPKVTRRANYDKNSNGKYYGYAYYKDSIYADCKHRCVYCDIVIEEAGFEGFALDHFKPQEHFPELKNDPCNLVVACAKCNRLKSFHWPVDKTLGVSHDGNVGFVDPFDSERHDYFEIKQTGMLSPLKPPSEYLITLLSLNRASRLLVRRNRLLKQRVDELISQADLLIDEACNALAENQSCDVRQKLQTARLVIQGIKSIRENMGITL